MAKRPRSSRRPDGDSKGPEPDDVFIARIVEFTTWAKSNSQTLVLLGVVAAVILGGVWYYVSFQRTVEDQALLQLEQIQQAALVGDPATARTEVAQFLERFGDTPASGEARLLLATLHMQEEQYEQAIGVLDEAGIPLRQPLGVQLETLRGKALEGAERMDEAERAYLQVADAAELGFQRVEALAAAARLRTSGERYDGAAELYERILEELDETDPQRGLYEMRLAEVQAAGGG